MTPEPVESTEELLHRGARLLEQSRRLLIDLDALATADEPDAVASE